MEDLRPSVLNIGHTPTNRERGAGAGVRTPERFAYDYEIEFFLADGGVMFVEDEAHAIRRGDLVFRRPGQRCNSIPPYSCWYIILDLMSNTGKTSADYRATRFLRLQNLVHNPLLDSLPAFIRVSDESRYINLFTTINLLARSPADLDRLALRIRLLELLHLIALDSRQVGGSAAERESSRAVLAAQQYITQHVSDKLTLEDLSARANLSPIYFHRLFHRITQVTPALYIQQVRLDRARYLLQHTALSCSEIAEDCGFNTASYFGYVFRRHYQITPNAYRSHSSTGQAAPVSRRTS
jgi:AraC-like DNA-binding protein